MRSYYHTVLPFFDEENHERDDLAFWRGIAAESRPRHILELGAGTGRVTAALREFAPVMAVDLLPEMLQRAAVRLDKQQTRRSCATELVVADMRCFAFAQRFDLVVAANDPFSHMTQRRDRQRALRAIAKHLAPGASLVIEGLYRPQRKRFAVAEHGTHELAVRELWEPRGRHDCWRAHYYYRRGETEVEAQFTARSWNPAEAEELLASCGLKLQKMWGDFNRRPFTPNAGRIILLAE